MSQLYSTEAANSNNNYSYKLKWKVNFAESDLQKTCENLIIKPPFSWSTLSVYSAFHLKRAVFRPLVLTGAVNNNSCQTSGFRGICSSDIRQNYSRASIVVAIAKLFLL